MQTEHGGVVGYVGNSVVVRVVRGGTCGTVCGGTAWWYVCGEQRCGGVVLTATGDVLRACGALVGFAVMKPCEHETIGMYHTCS